MAGADVGCIGRLGEAEVQHLDGPSGGDLDVGWLEIAMDDALGVRGVERFGRLSSNAERFADR